MSEEAIACEIMFYFIINRIPAYHNLSINECSRAVIMTHLLRLYFI